MLVVWNCDRGHTYGFANLADYCKYAIDTQGIGGRDCWNDYVYDVGDKGGCTEDCERLDMFKFNLECSGD